MEAFQVNFADVLVKKKHASVKEYGGTISQQRYIEEELVHYQYQAEYSLDGKTWAIYDKAQDTTLPHHLLTLSVKARYIRVLFHHAPYDQNFSLSGLRVFGLGDGEKPSIVTDAEGTRLSATKGKIFWKKKEDAIGYCIRIGIAKISCITASFSMGRTNTRSTSSTRKQISTTSPSIPLTRTESQKAK